MKKLINSITLNVNTNCNFKCLWCYNGGYKGNTEIMPYKLALDLLKLGAELKINNLVLIGGEPTIYLNFSNLITNINQMSVENCILMTNGSRFHDDSFLKIVSKIKNLNIGFSIKAFDNLTQTRWTGVNCFRNTALGIKKLQYLNNLKKIEYNVTISKYNINNLEDFAELISNYDKKNILIFSLCYPIFTSSGLIDKSSVVPLQKLVNTLVSKFDRLYEITEGRIYLGPTFPLCMWPNDFRAKLKKLGCIYISHRNEKHLGLIFDAKGNLLLYNPLKNYPIGTFGKDFATKEELEVYLNNPKIQAIYKQLNKLPLPLCYSCSNLHICGGGDPLFWLTYNVKDFKLLDKC